jgi:hypothetical protein
MKSVFYIVVSLLYYQVLVVGFNNNFQILSVYSLNNQTQNSIEVKSKQIGSTERGVFPVAESPANNAVNNDKEADLTLYQLLPTVLGGYELTGVSKQIAVGNDTDGRLVLFSIGLNSNQPGYYVLDQAE